MQLIVVKHNTSFSWYGHHRRKPKSHDLAMANAGLQRGPKLVHVGNHAKSIVQHVGGEQYPDVLVSILACTFARALPCSDKLRSAYRAVSILARAFARALRMAQNRPKPIPQRQTRVR